MTSDINKNDLKYSKNKLYKINETDHWLLQEINQLCGQINDTINGPQSFLDDIKDLRTVASELISIAPEYDYQDIQANGYWSWAHILKKYFKLVLLQHKLNPDFSPDQDLISLAKLGLIIADCLRKIRESSQKHSKNSGKLNLFSQDLVLASELFAIYASIDIDLAKACYGKYICFWLPTVCRRGIFGFKTIALLGNLNPSEWYKFLTSFEFRRVKITERIKNLNIDHIIKARRTMNNWIGCRILATYINGWLKPSRKSIYIPRQEKWTICQDTLQLKRGDGKNGHNSPVYCVALSGEEPTGQIVLSFHGGGYVLGNAACNEFYYRDWVNRIPGLIVISVDYSLAPENKIGIPMQEALDVYLWLTSGSQDVESNLGVKVSDIILEGDSAGGHLACSLLFMINDIKNGRYCTENNADSELVDGSDQIRLPKALFGVFPAFCVALYMSPSFIISSMDGVIDTSLLLNLLPSFLPCTPQDNLNNNNQENEKSWYHQPIDELRKNVKIISRIADSRFINLVEYNDFDSLRDVDLHIFAAQFDPLLDGSITMAKKWKGSVNLKVFDDLPHGWVLFNMISSCKEADIAMETLVQSLSDYFK